MIKVTPLQYDQYDHMIYQYVINMIKVPPLQTLTILGSFKTNFKEISRNLFLKTRYWKSSGCILFKSWTTCFFSIFLSLSAVADPALPSWISGCYRILVPSDLLVCILYFRCFVFPWPALACPHEYQEIMEIRCHQIEIGRKCAKHFHSLPFLLVFFSENDIMGENRNWTI